MGRYPGSNHVCNFWWWSVKGFWRGNGSNYPFLHWLASSPLQDVFDAPTMMTSGEHGPMNSRKCERCTTRRTASTGRMRLMHAMATWEDCGRRSKMHSVTKAVKMCVLTAEDFATFLRRKLSQSVHPLPPLRHDVSCRTVPTDSSVYWRGGAAFGSNY